MRRIFAAVLMVLLLTGCAAHEVQDTSIFAPADEQRLVIYSSHKEKVYAPIIEEFEQRTGIWVQLETGSTVRLLDRIAAGDTDCDLMFGGGVDSLGAYADCFATYHSPNAAIAAEYDLGDGRWTPFSVLSTVLIYNPKLVRQNPPTGWESLLHVGWRGKIAFADPAVSGSSYTALCTLLQARDGNMEDTLRSFAINLHGQVLPDSGDVVTAVADGSCYIGVTLEENALKAVADGYDIAVVYPEEGTSMLPDGAAIVAGCAHEENAQKFIDFLLEKSVQSRLMENFYRRSVRADLQAENAAPVAAIDYDLDWAGAEQEGLLRNWKALCEEAAS